MHIQIEMQDLLKDLKEYTDLMEYLHFCYEYSNKYHMDHFGRYCRDEAYREKFNKEPPEVV